jgi:hypothetical protein
MWFSGPQPRAAMALLFVSTRAKDFCHAIFTILTMSERSSVAGKPARISFVTVSVLAFMLLVFNVPFCSTLSPTCHNDLPYGSPIQHVHG